MDEEKCLVDLGPDEKEGWKIYVREDCEKVLEDIRKNLGEYGQRYLNERIVKVETKAVLEPIMPAEQKPDQTLDSETGE